MIGQKKSSIPDIKHKILNKIYAINRSPESNIQLLGDIIVAQELDDKHTRKHASMTDMKAYSLTTLVAAITKNPGSGPMLLVDIGQTANTSRIHEELSALSEDARKTLHHKRSAVIRFKTLEDAKRTLEQIKKDVPQTSCLHLHAVLFDHGVMLYSYD